MTMKWNDLFLFTWISGLTAGFSAIGQASDTNHPNILMILVDDLGWGDIGLHGNTGIETPNLDRLGQESVRFSHFYAEPVCAPTRASLMTGRYYLRTGVYGVNGAEECLNLDEATFADLLRKNGYATGMSGKWHLGDPAPYDPGSRGFQSVLSTGSFQEHRNPTFVLPSGERTDPVEGWSSELLADHAIEFMQDNRTRPFVYFLSFNQPHNPWNCPDSYLQKYLDKGFSPSLSLLYGMIEHLDAQIGRVLDELESLDLDRDTVVLFASDNGPIGRPARPGFPNLTDEEIALRNPSGFKGRKAQVWENGVRVPLFVRWKGKIEPTVVSEPVHVTDLFPTFLDWSGTPLPSGNLPVDGTSLRPLLNGDPESWGDRVFFSRSAVSVPEVTEDGVTRLDDKAQIDYFLQRIAAWEERYKFVKFNQHQHLFQIHDDPTESHDLSSSDPERLNRMGSAVGTWFVEMVEEPSSFQKPVFHIVPEGVDRIRMMGAAAFELHGGVELNHDGVRVRLGEDLIRVSSVNGTKNWASEGDGAKYRLQVVESAVYDILLEGVFTPMTGDLTLLMGERMQSMPVTVGNRIEFRGVEMASGRQDLLIRLENVEEAAVDPLEINAVIFSRSMPPPPLTKTRWRTATDGFWADAGNWEPSKVPHRYDEVTLPENVHVTIQDLHAEAASIHLQNGELFLHQSPSASLLVEGDLVQQGGRVHQRAGRNSGKIFIRGNYFAEAGGYRVLQGNVDAIRIGGDLMASPGFEFTFVLHNSSTFGNLSVSGQTDLGGANLQLAHYTENTTVSDEMLILVRNSSSQQVQGSFSNATFGETIFLINNRQYVLDLADADGDGNTNDVALIRATMQSK